MNVHIAALALLILSTSTAIAQSPAVAGDRVRLQLVMTGPRVSGRLIAWSADSLLVSTSAKGRRMISTSSIQSLDVSRKSTARSDAVRNGVWGLAIGGVAGGLAGSSEKDSYTNKSSTLPGLVVGGALGMTAGATFGAIRGRERWQRATIPVPSTASLLALQGGASRHTELQLESFALNRPIRARTQDGPWVTGTYGGMKDGYAQIDGETQSRIPVVDITEVMERKSNRGPATRKGLLWGAIVGGVTIAALGAWASGMCEASCPSPEAAVLGGAAFGVMAGGATGALVGAAIGSLQPQWRSTAW